MEHQFSVVSLYTDVFFFCLFVGPSSLSINAVHAEEVIHLIASIPLPDLIATVHPQDRGTAAKTCLGLPWLTPFIQLCLLGVQVSDTCGKILCDLCYAKAAGERGGRTSS